MSTAVWPADLPAPKVWRELLAQREDVQSAVGAAWNRMAAYFTSAEEREKQRAAAEVCVKNLRATQRKLDYMRTLFPKAVKGPNGRRLPSNQTPGWIPDFHDKLQAEFNTLNADYLRIAIGVFGNAAATDGADGAAVAKNAGSGAVATAKGAVTDVKSTVAKVIPPSGLFSKKDAPVVMGGCPCNRIERAVLGYMKPYIERGQFGMEPITATIIIVGGVALILAAVAYASAMKDKAAANAKATESAASAYTGGYTNVYKAYLAAKAAGANVEPPGTFVPPGLDAPIIDTSEKVDTKGGNYRKDEGLGSGAMVALAIAVLGGGFLLMQPKRG